MTISLLALVVGVAGIILGAFVLASDGDGAPASPSPETTRSPSPLPTATPSPSPPAEPPVDAIALRVVGDRPFPRDTAILTVTYGYGHGSTLSSWRERMFWHDGEVVHERSLTLPAGVDGLTVSAAGVVQDQDGVLFAAIAFNESSDVRETAFYRSDDGGASWQEINRRTGAWTVRNVRPGDAMALNFEGPEIVAVWVASNEAVTSVNSLVYTFMYRGEPAWPSTEFPMLVTATGQSFVKFDYLPIEARIEDVLAPIGSRYEYVLWRLPGDTANRRFLTTTYNGALVSHIEVGGAVESLHSVVDAGGSEVVVSGFVGARPVTCDLAAMPGGDIGAAPALLNIQFGTLAFIADPYLPLGCATGGEVVAAIWRGPFMQVSGAGYPGAALLPEPGGMIDPESRWLSDGTAGHPLGFCDGSG